MRKLAAMVVTALNQKGMHGKTLVLKVRDVDFVTQTKRLTQDHYFEGEQAIYTAAWQLWQEVKLTKLAIRLLGITVTGLDPKQYENIDLPL